MQEIGEEDKRVKLIRRLNNRGRGSAGITGFKFALENHYDYVIEMDADFSHDPTDIPKFLSAIKDYDLILGSRLIKGGKQIGRSFYRKTLTALANFYIRVILDMNISDCNSGYRCFRREVLESINLDKVISTGPDIVQEILYKAYLKGFKIKEIPITFRERKLGSSKLGMKHLYKGYIKILSLKWQYLIRKI